MSRAQGYVAQKISDVLSDYCDPDGAFSSRVGTILTAWLGLGGLYDPGNQTRFHGTGR